MEVEDFALPGSPSGVAVSGDPILEEFIRVDADTGYPPVVQHFERHRLE
ncbi:MAG: hypothetical protein NZL87_05640 [Thermomicrobium sp.]|nr:hypothetical protein [Thermomicrobium sp.]